MFSDLVKLLVQYWDTYQTACPLAPYTGYMILGFLMGCLFCLWRNAANTVHTLKSVNRTLAWVAENYKSPPITVKCDTAEPSQHVLGVIRSIQQEALEAVLRTQEDAANKMAETYTTTLAHVEKIVESFNTEPE
jgi:hypothetical protein